jgi:presenilin-like A22 family membrane protease
MTEESERFKAQVIYLAPVLASMLFGFLCATLFVTATPSSQPTYPPVPWDQTTAEGASYNAIYFVTIVAVGATLIYFLLKYRGRRTLNFLIWFAMTLAFGLLGMVYFSELLANVPNGLAITIALTAALTVLGDLAIFRFRGKVADVVVIGLGGALGAFLGGNLTVLTAVPIIIALAIYDVIAVYRGPVGKIASSSGGMDQLKGLSYSFKDIQMGLGDLVFYSLLVATMFVHYNLAAGLFAFVGILIGSYLTFLVLERRDVFPGLPIPLALGTVLGVLAGLLL